MGNSRETAFVAGTLSERGAIGHDSGEPGSGGVPPSAPGSSDPDAGVLARVAEGDVESFGLLVERHERRLFGLCHRMLGSGEEARDTVQDVFLDAFRNASRFEPRGRVYTWLYRIAVNRCLKRLRRRKIVRFLSFGEAAAPGEAEETAELDPAEPSLDPEARLAERRRWLRTRERIDRLPSSQRTVLILAKVEGLSYREIARVMEITESAVESRLVRAMRKLSEGRP
ncbi:MAG: RNA polymerase sigma factor [Holophagales bacterium]|nr:RNA polymerase sigma factor [Holophagales bacterium]